MEEVPDFGEVGAARPWNVVDEHDHQADDVFGSDHHRLALHLQKLLLLLRALSLNGKIVDIKIRAYWSLCQRLWSIVHSDTHLDQVDGT